MSVIYTILIFGIIIFIHELGHFIMAKLNGVRVNEFALGMGPAILKYQGKETLYALRLLPIGGYAAMEGENDTIEEKTDGEIEIPKTKSEKALSHSFSDKSTFKRIIICAAGPIMNLILGFLITACTLIGATSFATTTISSFRENSVTNEWLMVGDKVVKVNKTSILTDRDIVFEALRDDDGIMDFTVIRNGERVLVEDVKFTTTEKDGEKSLYFDFTVLPQEVNFFTSVSRAARETISLARNSWASIGDLITGKVPFSELSGPVGVGKVVSEAAKVGFMSVVSLAAFISISIGMFNLLPFPALDGGRIVIYAIEAIRRKPISPKAEGYLNAVGLIVLLLLMVVITFKDVISLF